MHCKSFECSLHRIIQAVSLTLLRPRLSSKRFRFWGVTVWWCVCSNDVIAASVLWMQKSVHIICINIRNHSNLSFTILELGVWQDFHFLVIFPSGVAWRTCGVQKTYFQNLRLTLRSTPCVFAKRASCKIWSLYNILVDCGSRSHGRHGRCSLAWSTGIQNIRKTAGWLVDEKRILFPFAICKLDLQKDTLR